jgi:FkbM family methyltransferase
MMFSGLKGGLRRLLESHGYQIYRRPWLPKGTDPWETLNVVWPRWKPDVVFDVGANVGDTTLQLAARHPAAVIHAFEPVTDTYATLVQRTSGNSRIHAYQLALGASAGRARINLFEHSTLSSLAASNTSPSARWEESTVSTIDTFCATRDIARINLLKTDTEGHELAVFAGANRILTTASCDVILVECGLCSDSPRFVPLPSVAAVLLRHGFVLLGVFDQRGWSHRLAAEFADALFVRRELLPE